MELRMLDENGGCRKEKEREKFLQKQRIQRWYGAAVLKNPLESQGKGERAWGAPAAIGHSAIFAGIHASVPRYLLERFSSLVRSRRVEERASEDLVLARASRSRARFSILLSSCPPPHCKCTRLAVLYARYLLLSLNILNFIYGCPSRFIVVRAALFALTCFVLL